MLEEFLAISIGTGIALLIIFKSDQQSIIILKGKLNNSNLDKEIARQTYMKYSRAFDIMLTVFGISMLFLSINLFARERSLFYIPGIGGIILAGVGIWGRCKTFLAADRELGEIGKARQRGQEE